MIGRGRSAIIGLLACLCLSFETGPVEPELEGKQVEIKKKAAQTKSRKPSRRTCLCKGGGFAIHCHSADEEGGPTLCALKSIPRPLEPKWNMHFSCGNTCLLPKLFTLRWLTIATLESRTWYAKVVCIGQRRSAALYGARQATALTLI